MSFARLAAALAALMLTAPAAFARPNIGSLEYRCNNARDSRACRELVKLAEHNGEQSIRIAAAFRLNS